MNNPSAPLTVESLLAENTRRRAIITAPYDPLTGDPGAPDRSEYRVAGLEEADALWIPRPMLADPFVRSLEICGSVDAYIKDVMQAVPGDEARLMVRRKFIRCRILHDFPYWAASFVYIKPKGGGPDTLFTLNPPQRRLVGALEEMRVKNLPIRLIVLKARQWGGSTCVQLYMAWLQMVHAIGLNSLIIAHQGIATDEIKDMFDRMLLNYPDWLMTDEEGEVCKGKRIENVGGSRGAFRVPHRKCKVKLGSAERPHSCRGGDYNLVHCSEVGVWPSTRLRTPEQLMQ